MASEHEQAASCESGFKLFKLESLKNSLTAKLDQQDGCN